MELIRAHTKTDDIPYVTDEQLELYRTTAFEHAERYTGRILTGVASVQQMAETKRHNYRRKNTFQLAFPTLDGIVTLYGPTTTDLTHNVQATPGSRKINLPIAREAIDVNDCCGGCGRGGINYGMKILYRTGVRSADEIAQGIRVGALKFIAWCVSNPGDELLTVRNRLGTTETGLIGTNNAAWASGAIEAWRLYKIRS